MPTTRSTQKTARPSPGPSSGGSASGSVTPSPKILQRALGNSSDQAVLGAEQHAPRTAKPLPRRTYTAEQRAVMHSILNDHRGLLPSEETIATLAVDFGREEQQIRRWFQDVIRRGGARVDAKAARPAPHGAKTTPSENTPVVPAVVAIADDAVVSQPPLKKRKADPRLAEGRPPTHNETLVIQLGYQRQMERELDAARALVQLSIFHYGRLRNGWTPAALVA